MKHLVARCRLFLRQLKLRSTRKLVVAVVGGSVVLVGIALIFLPGPAFVVIPMGLAILATEFVWARRWLKRARALLNKTKPSLAVDIAQHPMPEEVSVKTESKVPQPLFEKIVKNRGQTIANGELSGTASESKEHPI